MDRSVVVFIEGVIAFIVLAGTGMGAFSLWLRARRLQAHPDHAALEPLREENTQLRDRLAELEERVDFVERRLIQGHPLSQLPQPEMTPV